MTDQVNPPDGTAAGIPRTAFASCLTKVLVITSMAEAHASHPASMPMGRGRGKSLAQAKVTNSLSEIGNQSVTQSINQSINQQS